VALASAHGQKGARDGMNENPTGNQLDVASADARRAAMAAEERVSVLVGDRLCTTCGYNLTGQHVLREPHYHMLIVRCPECATVASLQEYPLLGRWANRWAAILAAVCLVLLLGLWIGSGAMLFGFAVGTAEFAADDYSDFLATRFNAWQQAQTATPTTSPATTAPGNVITTPSGQVIVINAPGASRFGDFSAWWTSQDHATLLAEAGGWWNAIDHRAFWMWLPMTLLAFAAGCFWAVALLGRTRKTLPVWGGAIMAVAMLFSFFALHEWLTDDPGWYHTAARSQIAPAVLMVTLAVGATGLMIGLLAGRSTARGLVRMMLPPRLCNSLALLWTADGLVPPSPPRATNARR
jgi:hypothetical protein